MHVNLEKIQIIALRIVECLEYNVEMACVIMENQIAVLLIVLLNVILMACVSQEKILKAVLKIVEADLNVEIINVNREKIKTTALRIASSSAFRLFSVTNSVAVEWVINRVLEEHVILILAAANNVDSRIHAIIIKIVNKEKAPRIAPMIV